MDLQTFKDLGIAGIAVGALAYICYQLIKQLAEARAENRNFINSNNHTTTELVKEATATMVEVRNSIEKHNELTARLIKKLK